MIAKTIIRNGEEVAPKLIPVRPVDLDIYRVLKLIVSLRGGASDMVLDVTTSDIRSRLGKPCQKLTIRRGLKRLEKAGLIRLTLLGYNRWGFSVLRNFP